jgi:predicted Zn-dependent protease
MAQLERSIAIDPTIAGNHRLLGRTYGQVGRPGEAFYHLAKAFELEGKLRQALSHYVRSRDALDPDDELLEATRASIKELEDIVGEKQEEERGRGRKRPSPWTGVRHHFTPSGCNHSSEAVSLSLWELFH